MTLTICKTKTILAMIPVGELRAAKQNKITKRTEESNRALQEMARSMDKYGQLVPILISKTGEVIEGHRRVAAARMLGWTHVEAKIYDGPHPLPEIYAQANKHMKSHSGVQELAIWFVRPEAVTPQARAKFENYQRKFGRRLITRLVRSGMSLVYLNWTIRAVSYIGLDKEDKELMKKIATWIIDHKAQSAVRTYINSDQDPVFLWSKIQKNEPLKKAYV